MENAFLRDPMWQFIAAVAAVTAIVVMVCLHLVQRRRKAFAYSVPSVTHLTSVSREVKDKVQIQFEGQSVGNVSLVLVRVGNAGNVPICEDDFVAPVTVDLGEGARVLTAEISDSTPRDLRPSVTTEGGKVTLGPLLLNQGDAMTLKVLAAGASDTVMVDGRIVGVSKVERRSGQIGAPVGALMYAGCFVLVTLSCIAAVSMLRFALSPGTTMANVVALSAMLAFLVVLASIAGLNLLSRLLAGLVNRVRELADQSRS